jgi:TonB family protein
VVLSLAACTNSRFIEKRANVSYYDDHTPGPDRKHTVDTVAEPVGGMRSFASHLDYPREIRRQRITGVVRVRIVMDAKGHVVSAQIAHSVHPVLDDIVLKAVLKTRWTSATRGGKPVPHTFLLPITFGLTG